MPIPSYRQPWARSREPSPFDRPRGRSLTVLLDPKLSSGDTDGAGAFQGYPFLPGGAPGHPDGAAILRSYAGHGALDILQIVQDPTADCGVVLDSTSHRGILGFEVHRRDGGSWSGIDRYDDLVEDAPRVAARCKITEEEALEGMTFLALASQIGADLAVTDRPWLVQENSRRKSRYLANVSTSADALALVALYLRWHSESVIIGGAPLHWADRSMRWTAAGSAIPAWWRWRQAGCVHSRATGDRTAEALTEAFLTRASRALRFRDKVHCYSFDEVERHVEDMLCEFDSLLYSLVGAFDVAARVADVYCQINTPRPDGIGWQKKEWRKELANREPALHAFTASGTEPALVFEAMRCLRNTAHSEALRTVGYSDSTGDRRVLVSLPPYEEAKLTGLLATDASAWGVEQIPTRIAVDACKFTERLVPTAFRALDGILARTPILALQGYRPSMESPRTDDRWKTSNTTAHRVRLMYGLA